MTRNQIEYWNLQESKRANQAKESETGRHNLATESETGRHNQVQEGIDLGHLNESVRHNRVTESETKRHNVAGEQETSRHNRVTETETNRHNVVSEGIDLGKLSETTRHNRATEGISYGELRETTRHNLANEAIGSGNLSLGYANLNEQAKHNRNTESIQKYIAVSNSELNNAKRELTETQKGWYGVEASAKAALSSDQRRQIDAQIQKYQQEVANLEQTHDWNTYQQILDGLDTLSRIFSSMDDLQRAIEGYGKGSDQEKKYSKYLDNLLEEIRNEN